MSDPAPSQLARVARELALQSGLLLMRWYRTLEPDDVQFKGRRNPVTEADLASERLIVEGLRQQFPEHHILAEEEGARPGTSGYQWIIDPLDGTVNFSHGLPVFAVAMAVRRDTELLASVIYAPALEELYVAERGAGATLNDQPIRVSSTDRLDQSLLATGFAYVRNEVEDNNVDHFNDLILEVRDIRRMGSAAVDFALVAAGRYDGFWELNLAPWDVAAGTLLVQEAGGRVTDVDGGDDMIEKGHFLASNGPLHPTLLEVLGRRRS